MNKHSIALTCICCPIGCALKIEKADGGFTITGNKCPRGKQYGLEEIIAPKRIVTSTVKINGGSHPVISVKTSKPVPKEKIFAIMQLLSCIEANAPIKTGDIIIANAADSGADIIATKTIDIIESSND